MNDFGTQDSRMLEYRLASTPVSTGQKHVLATSFVRNDGILVVLASWSAANEEAILNIDWNALGMASEDAVAHAPEVGSIRAVRQIELNEPVEIASKQELFIRIDRR